MDSDAVIDEFVVPFYLDLMNAGIYRFSKQASDSKDRIQFETAFRQALNNVTPEAVDIILADDGWRTQLVGSWFCAVKGWRQFGDRIASALMADRSGYAGQIFCLIDAPHAAIAKKLKDLVTLGKSLERFAVVHRTGHRQGFSWILEPQMSFLNSQPYSILGSLLFPETHTLFYSGDHNFSETQPY